MKLLQKHWVILTILVFAVALRFWQLGSVPPSPDWDEVALGYNAYSVLKTGRDEYGTWFPLSLRSFDDYKPPLYMYLTIPSVAIFGLNVWSTRLPSAVLGVLAVLGTYIVVSELIKRDKKDFEFLRHLPVLVSLLLALSPWHIQFSRIAFEANVGVTINIWVAVLFLKGLKKPWWLLGSAFLAALGLYAYHSERVFMPLFVLLLGFLFWKELWIYKKQLLWAIIVGIFTIAPLVPVTFSKTALTRLQGTSSLADQTVLLSRSVIKLEEDMKNGDTVGQLFDNRRLVWLKTIVNGYLSHFSIKWLFVTGDNPRHHAPDMGLLYMWEFPFWLYGMYAIAKRGGKLRTLAFGWLLIAPIAASPTTELPHAIRTLVFLPMHQLFTGAGVLAFLESISHKGAIRKVMLGILSLVVLWNITYYLHMYFGHMNREVSFSWQYGYKEAVAYANSHRNQYKKIVVSTKLEQPHMFFLFYLAFDPASYLSHGGTSSGGFAEVRNSFDIYEFRPIHWEKENHDGTTLYIGAPQEVPASLGTIHYLDGTNAIHIGT